MDTVPLSMPYDLAKLSDAGAEIEVSADPEQQAKLARWAAVDAVNSFTAKIALRRPTKNRFEYEAHLEAAVVQECVITLEPVSSQIALNVSRDLHLSNISSRAQIGLDELSAGSDEGPEEIESPQYDLAGPLLEEFALAVDPYPRAPGVMFEAPHSDQEVGNNPFAVLKALKGHD